MHIKKVFQGIFVALVQPLLLAGCILGYSPSGPFHPKAEEIVRSLDRQECLERITTGYRYQIHTLKRPSSGWSSPSGYDAPAQAIAIEQKYRCRVDSIDTIHLYYSSLGYTRWRLFIDSRGLLIDCDKVRFN